MALSSARHRIDPCRSIAVNCFRIDVTDIGHGAGLQSSAAEVARLAPEFAFSYPSGFALLQSLRVAILSESVALTGLRTGIVAAV